MGSIVHRSVPTNLKWFPNCSHAHALFQDRFKDVQVGSRWFSTLYILSPNFHNLIGSLYNDPQFKVCVGEAESTWRSQCSGIRQGCPLSPYLFTLVMGALFADVMEEICTSRQLEPLDGLLQ